MNSPRNRVQNGKIKGARIIGSYVDMEFNDLINVRTPIDPQDAVPKSYIDSLVPISSPISYPTIPFTLSGVTPTTIKGDLIGTFDLQITCVDTSGPSASFNVCKNHSSYPAVQKRFNAFPGYNTGTFLEIIWDPGLGIQIVKTNGSFDGPYIATIK